MTPRISARLHVFCITQVEPDVTEGREDELPAMMQQSHKCLMIDLVDLHYSMFPDPKKALV